MLRRFALGTRAPQVSGVKVVRSAATGGADADDVALDVEFIWGGNPVRALLPIQAPGLAMLLHPLHALCPLCSLGSFSHSASAGDRVFCTA